MVSPKHPYTPHSVYKSRILSKKLVFKDNIHYTIYSVAKKYRVNQIWLFKTSS